MASSDNVFVNAGYVEDGYYELIVVTPPPPAVINIGAPGAALTQLPYRSLGGSVIDLDLLYGLLNAPERQLDIQPIFAIATRAGVIRAWGYEVPRQGVRDVCLETFSTLL